MRILFIHQNFPGQFKHLYRKFADNPNNGVVVVGEQKNRAQLPPGVTPVWYSEPNKGGKNTHHYLRDFEGHIRRGQAVYRTLKALKATGFHPDVICAHPGWGEALFVKDVFPKAKTLFFWEFFYSAYNENFNFDPEFPANEDDALRVRILNSTQLASMEVCDWGFSPTAWQLSQYPERIQKKSTRVHDGIDTDFITPDPNASVRLTKAGVNIKKGDEVVTFVSRNLEPYRGFHSFMRSLPHLVEKRPNARILIVGGNEVSYGRKLPEGESYKDKYIQEIGLPSDRIHFLGRIPYSVFIQLLQVSAAHVYLTYPFVLSWSMLEAMSTEALVIGSATPPVQEVIKDGRNGLLVDFFDYKGIAETVAKALESPEKYAKLRKNARKTVQEKYDLKRVCLPKQVELVERLGQGKSPKGGKKRKGKKK